MKSLLNKSVCVFGMKELIFPGGIHWCGVQSKTCKSFCDSIQRRWDDGAANKPLLPAGSWNNHWTQITFFYQMTWMFYSSLTHERPFSVFFVCIPALWFWLLIFGLCCRFASHASSFKELKSLINPLTSTSLWTAPSSLCHLALTLAY